MFDLFCDLEASDAQADFTTLYAIGRQGLARRKLTDTNNDLQPLFETIVDKIPPPSGDPEAPLRIVDPRPLKLPADVTVEAVGDREAKGLELTSERWVIAPVARQIERISGSHFDPGLVRDFVKERSDEYALNSQQKLAKAYEDGKIQPDLVPVATRHAEKGWGLATTDEPPRPQTTMDDLRILKTPFRPHGKVTAGNAAGLNDGATACLLASEEVAAELGLTAKMRLVSYAFVGVEPEVMGIGPVPATEKALASAGLTIEDIGLFELNEAFAVQVLAFLDHFGIADDDPRVNEYGGAIATGHPLASSGVRLMTQLARQFEEHPEVRFGLTSMCIGIGMGGTVIWENPHHADYVPSADFSARKA